MVIRKGSVYVTAGTDRRSSGTHYTPRSLTEPIVQYTLEPLVYVGPAEGKPKEEWKLRSPRNCWTSRFATWRAAPGVSWCRRAGICRNGWSKPGNGRKPSNRCAGITPEGTESTGAAGELLIPKETDERRSMPVG